MPRRVAAATSSMTREPIPAYWVRTPSTSRPFSITSSSLLHCAAMSWNPALSMIARSMSTSPKSKSAIRIVPLRSVRVTGNPLGVYEILVRHGEFETASAVQLPDRGAVDLLPRCLVLECRPNVLSPSLGDLLIGQENVDARAVQVDADPVAGAQDGEVAAGRGFGAGVENGGGVRRAALPAVTERGQRGDASLDQRGRKLHVHDLGRARIADRPGVADDEDAALVYAQLRIFDAGVVVLRPVEDDGAQVEHRRIPGPRPEAAPEGVRDDRCLNDRGVEQVPGHDEESSSCGDRVVEGADDRRVGGRQVVQILGH